MDIINLSEEYEDIYCKCLEDCPDEMDETGGYKREWFEKKRAQGLRVKLARNEKNEIVGMIHYIPIENAPVNGKDLFYIYCIWVHGSKQGVGNYQNKGIGTSLLKAAENDAQELGAKGMVAWGIMLPFFMRSKWFKKHGYRRADKEGMIELVWKPFKDNVYPPQLIKQKKKPEVIKDTVTVTCFRNGWCPGQNLACERMKRAVSEYQGKIRYLEIDTDIRENLDEWGISDGIFVDHKQITTGSPPEYKALHRILRKRIERVKK